MREFIVSPTTLSSRHKTMNRKTTIICSAPDLASMNIKENLLAMQDWVREGDVYESDRVRIVEVDKLHIF